MIQKKKFVKTFRNTKTVQLILLLLLETAYVLVLTLKPCTGHKAFRRPDSVYLMHTFLDPCII